MRSRNVLRLSGRLTAIAGFLLVPFLLSAQNPKLNGTWQMDAAKSDVADGRVLQLTLTTQPDKVKVVLSTTNKDGKTFDSEFACSLNGKECEFNENGHKSKVTAWFNGEVLNTCKTDGPAGDVVSEWKLELSSDKKTLTLTISHIDPSSKDETVVFSKKDASPTT